MTSIPTEIGYLVNLRELVLGGFQAGNLLTEIPSELGKLKKLTKLSLGGNKISNLPDELWQLTNLTTLDLGSNRLTEIPSMIGNLVNLNRLWLGGNSLNQLPTEIGLLEVLTELYLGSNRLLQLPESIGSLRNLTELEIGGNFLNELPRTIGQLQKLFRLDVSNNRITSLPDEIGEIQELTRFNARDNQLAELPETLKKLNKLTELELSGNPLQIPLELLEQKNKPAEIIDYYLNKIFPSKTKFLNEAKLIIVGQGEVGKTSLVKRLLDNHYNDNETSTGGINIRRWILDIIDREIRLNIWDFGGQEIMHATHQFFLTKRSLYILVLDARKGEQDSKLEYWLKLIQSYGGDAPIIVVVNKIDEHILDLDQRGLLAKYPSIVGFSKVSCKTNIGIDELKEMIKTEASKLEHLTTEWLANEFTIKTQLEESDADYILYEQYVSMCKDVGIQGERQQRDLIKYLHDLGIVLNYQDDPRLEETNILNPEWVTNGVYKIINSELLAKNNGILEKDMLSEILDHNRYPREKHMFIIDMMRKFELCFSYEGQRDQRFLIPDLLPKERPSIKWDESIGLAFQYHYDVLPASVISRFIVRMNEYVEIDKAWRSGVVLKDENNQALVRADFVERKVFIWVIGNKSTQRSFLGIVRFHFKNIHNSIAKITIDYSDLLQLEKRSKLKYYYPKADIEIDVSQLLDGIGNLSLPQSAGTNKKVRLRELLITYFDDNELKDLFFQLGLDYEDFKGFTRTDKARELIVAAERRGLLDDLIKKSMQMRPRMDWSGIE